MPDSIAPPLLDEIRALYEGRVMPVREIAQRAGITERALYKHVRNGGWQRRNAFASRGDADDGLATAVATAAAGIERERWARVIDHASATLVEVATAMAEVERRDTPLARQALATLGTVGEGVLTIIAQGIRRQAALRHGA